MTKTTLGLVMLAGILYFSSLPALVIITDYVQWKKVIQAKWERDKVTTFSAKVGSLLSLITFNLARIAEEHVTLQPEYSWFAKQYWINFFDAYRATAYPSRQDVALFAYNFLRELLQKTLGT